MWALLSLFVLTGLIFAIIQLSQGKQLQARLFPDESPLRRIQVGLSFNFVYWCLFSLFKRGKKIFCYSFLSLFWFSAHSRIWILQFSIGFKLKNLSPWKMWLKLESTTGRSSSFLFKQYEVMRQNSGCRCRANVLRACQQRTEYFLIFRVKTWEQIDYFLWIYI